MMKRVVLAMCLNLAMVAGLAVVSEAVVSTTPPRNDYIGNGSTATYSYTFRIFESSDLKVTKRSTIGDDTPLTLTTDYTVTGVGNASGGTITLVAGNLPSGYSLTIRFDRVPKQSTDLRNQGRFYPETHENKFDELTRYAQQSRDVEDRALKFPETETGYDGTLPNATTRANQFLAFDANGDVTTSNTVTGVTPIYGTWTPSVGGTATYTVQSGYYVKIGRLVFIYGTMTINAIGTGSQTTISGLPFTTKNSSSTFQTFSVSKVANLAVSVTSTSGTFSIFGTNFYIYSRTAAAASETLSNIFGNGSSISFSGVYEAVS